MVKTPISREVLVQRALELADAEGLAAVTLRRLAQELDVTPMALYWHVANKDELLDAMGDALFENIVVPQDGPWSQRLEILLHALVDALRAHPSSSTLAFGRVMASDRGLDLTEGALAVLHDAGFDSERSSQIARQALQTAVMLVQAEPGAEQHAGSPDQRQQHVDAKRAALEALPPERYPYLTAAGTSLLLCDDLSDYYRDGIGLFLAGVRAWTSMPVG